MKRSILAGTGILTIAVAFGLGVVTAQATDGGPAAIAADLSVEHGGHRTLPVLDFTPPTTAEAKIANALAALPSALRADARVVDYPAKLGDPYPQLRPGLNEWTCFPDLAISKGDDPICYDRVSMAWADAYFAGKNPPPTKEIGVIYRLRGGSDASLTEFIEAPRPGQEWLLHGPHMVLVVPPGTDTAKLSTAPGEHPWVMNRGTPYEHIHLPAS